MTLIPTDDRFVDRDMIMRYHWGLAIGHTYMHGDSQVDPSSSTEGASHMDEDEDMDADGLAMIAENEEGGESAAVLENDEDDGSAAMPENEEGTDDECGRNCCDEEDGSDLGDEEERSQDDEELLSLDEMYGESPDIEFYK
jgi:hypothetical protein